MSEGQALALVLDRDTESCVPVEVDTSMLSEVTLVSLKDFTTTAMRPTVEATDRVATTNIMMAAHLREG